MSQLNEGVDHPITGQLKSPVWQRLGQMASRPVPDMIGSTGNRQRLLKELGRLILRYRWLLWMSSAACNRY